MVHMRSCPSQNRLPVLVQSTESLLGLGTRGRTWADRSSRVAGGLSTVALPNGVKVASVPPGSFALCRRLRACRIGRPNAIIAISKTVGHANAATSDAMLSELITSTLPFGPHAARDRKQSYHCALFSLDLLPASPPLSNLPHLSPPTLTEVESQTILAASSENIRDHLIFSLALGTGRRLSELVGLDVGDVYAPDGTPRSRVRIRAEIAKGGRAGDIFLPDALAPKLRKFWAHKRICGEPTGPQDPLFCSQSRVRISKRRVQFAWRQWQVKAGFDRLYGFHGLRHSAITAVYRASRDLFLVQRFARHVSPLTTTVYTHPSDEEMFQGCGG